MNIMHYLLSCTLTLFSSIAHAGAFREMVSTVTRGEHGGLFLGIREEKQHQKKLLEKELLVLKEGEKAFHDRVVGEINEVTQERLIVKEELRAQPDDDFIVKKFALLNERFQSLKDLEKSYDKLIKTLSEFVKELTQFVDDPDYVNFKKEKKITDSLYYSFNDLLHAHAMIIEGEHRVKQLGDQAKGAQTELKSRERIITTLADEFKKKKEKSQEFDQSEDGKSVSTYLFDQSLYETRKELAKIRLIQGGYRVELLAFQQFVSKTHLALLKDYLRRIKSSIRIGESDVVEAKDSLKKLQQEYFRKKESYRHHIDELDAQQKVQESAFESASKQYNISAGRDLDDWSREPKKTTLSYVGLCKAGLINASLLLLKRNKELVEAHISLEDERFAYQTLQANIKETYYKINSRRFLSEEQITQEIKQYETTRSNGQGSLNSYQEKMSVVADLLNAQKKIVDNIFALRKGIDETRYTIFKNRIHEYTLCIDLLRRAERKIRDSIEVLGKLTGVYSGIVEEIQSSLRIANFIISESQSIITIWYRPSYAISWRGFTNVIRDVFIFIGELSSYFIRFNPRMFITRAFDSFSAPSILFFFFLKLFLLSVFFFFIYRFSISVNQILIGFAQKSRGLVKLFVFLVAFLFHFIRLYAISIGFLLVIYSISSAHIIPDPYLYVFFYLMVIPYLLYLVNRFFKTLVLFNKEHEYPILSQELQERFVLVLSVLAYTTVSLLLFRQAFLQINYYQPELYRSELPNILIAVNFIIFQLSLMLLITKEQILSIIPRRNAVTSWLYTQVDRYYYVLFCFALVILVMSHPYVGFSRLVIYLIFGLLYSAILIKVLLVLHNLLKRITKYLFFEERDQVVRERFANAKTWFGLSIIGSFLSFSFLGLLLGAKVWGWPITVKSALNWLYEPLLFKASANPITTFSLFEVIAFVVCGFLASYALNRFVLGKIFDLLLVDSGVQNMVTSILRYFIIATAVFLGLYSVNLGGLVTWIIAALGLSIGWVLKDPMADIVSYFIILVQRPIKIGDYVKIGEGVMGIVRKITPRSVVLRRRNSTTFVVPNSKIVTNSIENWNYARNFIAFDDIYITVHYKEDPSLIKKLLAQVVHDHPQILRNPKAIVRLSELGNRGYVFIVRGFISAAYTLDQWDIASDVRISVVKCLRENNIRLALPVMQVGQYELNEPLFTNAPKVLRKTNDDHSNN